MSALIEAAPSGGNHMLFMLSIVGLAIVMIAIGIIPRWWAPSGADSANLGSMSEQWLAQHRASHSQ